MAYRIVFVCLGNICRSPMAELAFRRLVDAEGLAGQIEVSSAGTGDYHVGEPADERAAEALRSRGYDPSEHRARQFSRADLAEADLVVSLDAANSEQLHRLAGTEANNRKAADSRKIRLLRSFDPAAAGSDDLDVPDPYYGGNDGFQRALDLVEAACRGLLEQVKAELVRAAS